MSAYAFSSPTRIVAGPFRTSAYSAQRNGCSRWPSVSMHGIISMPIRSANAFTSFISSTV